jgi:Ca2+-binding EF-hand superfamily protein
MSMAAFLSTLSISLAALSPSSELLSAFSAFDDDDSGQVDLAELRDALLHTAPEAGERALTEMEVDKVVNGFTGRRAFSKSIPSGFNKKGEVFKYQEFVHSVVGKEGGSEPVSNEGSEDT